MGAPGRQDTIVPGDGFTHARLVEDPRAQRGPQAWRDIPVRERGDARSALRGGEPRQPRLRQVVHQPARHDYGPGAVLDRHARLKRITADEPAAQPLPLGQPARLGHQHRIQVGAHQLNVGTQRRCCGQPPHHGSQAAANVDYADRAAPARPAELGDERHQQRRDTTAGLQFLTKALQLAMHPDTKRVHVAGIQDTIRRRDA